MNFDSQLQLMIDFQELRESGYLEKPTGSPAYERFLNSYRAYASVAHFEQALSLSDFASVRDFASFITGTSLAVDGGWSKFA